MQKQTDVYRKRRPMIVLAGLVLIWIGFNRISHHVLYGELSEHVSTAVAYDDSYDDEYVYSQAILSEDINAYLGEMDITTPIFLQTNEEWPIDPMAMTAARPWQKTAARSLLLRWFNPTLKAIPFRHWKSSIGQEIIITLTAKERTGGFFLTLPMQTATTIMILAQI